MHILSKEECTAQIVVPLTRNNFSYRKKLHHIENSELFRILKKNFKIFNSCHGMNFDN